jgi:hypothetical protein
VVELEVGSLAVVSDLVPGATLSSIRTARGGLTVPEVASILADVGDALAHLAARGVVHGDVSPANVIVDLLGEVVLVDLVGDVRIETGTPGFTAPERAAGGPASTASDVWALAVMVRDLAGGDEQVEHLTRDALDDDPGRRPTARALAARAAELGRRSSVRLPDSADMATALLRESALREATTHAPVRRERAGGRRAGGRSDRQGRTAQDGRASGRGIRARVRRHRPATGNGDHRRVRGGPARWGRGRVGLVMLVLAALGAGGISVAVGEAEGRVPRSGTGGNGAAEEILADLMARRDAALTASDPVALEAVTAPGSPARDADGALRAALVTTELVGLETRVSAVVVREGAVAAGEFTAEAVLTQADWRAVAGGELSTYPSGEACAVLRIVRETDDWAIAESRPCAPGG